MNLVKAYFLSILTNFIRADLIALHQEYHTQEALTCIHRDLCAKMERINRLAQYQSFMPRHLHNLFNTQAKVFMYVPSRAFSSIVSLPEQSYKVSLVKFAKSTESNLVYLNPVGFIPIETDSYHCIESILSQAYEIFAFVIENYQELAEANKEYLEFIFKLLLAFNGITRTKCSQAAAIFNDYHLKLDDLMHSSGIDDEEFTAASRKFIDILSPRDTIPASICKFGSWSNKNNGFIWIPASLQSYKTKNHHLALTSKPGCVLDELVGAIDSFLPESMCLVKFTGSFRISHAEFARTKGKARDAIEIISVDQNLELSNLKIISQLKIILKDLIHADLSEYEWVSIFAWAHTLAENLVYTEAEAPLLIECQKDISSAIYTFRNPLYISRMSHLSQLFAKLLIRNDHNDLNSDFLIHATQKVLHSVFRYLSFIYRSFLHLLQKIISWLL